VLLSGLSDAGPVTQIWRNTGSGFSNINAGLPDVQSRVSVSWGDYDNDGKLDVLLFGAAFPNYALGVWRNAGNGLFTNINAGLPVLQSGFVRWLDYDNDGWLDILLLGQVDSNHEVAQLWRNTGHGFTNIDIRLP